MYQNTKNIRQQIKPECAFTALYKMPAIMSSIRHFQNWEKSHWQSSWRVFVCIFITNGWAIWAVELTHTHRQIDRQTDRHTDTLGSILTHSVRMTQFKTQTSVAGQQTRSPPLCYNLNIYRWHTFANINSHTFIDLHTYTRARAKRRERQRNSYTYKHKLTHKSCHEI